jgi:hypothetical protein
MTTRRALHPPRRHRCYPREVKRARHNSYRVRGQDYTGTGYNGPPTIGFPNLKPAAATHRTTDPKTTHLQLTA